MRVSIDQPAVRVRRTVLALATALALLASGCGSDGPAPSGAATDGSCRLDTLAGATEPVEVTLWHMLPAMAGGRASPVFSEMVETFNRSQQKVRVKAKGFGSWQELVRRYFSLAPGDGELPDVVELWWGVNRAAVDTGRVVAAQACIDAAGMDLSDFVPQTLAMTKLEGRQWGLPVGHFGHVFLWDKGAFARAGLDPERPPATVAELRRAAEALKAAGVPHPLATPVIHPLFWLSDDSTDNGDGHAGRATQATFASDTTRSLLLWAKEMFDDDLVMPPKAGTPRFDDLAAIGRGESAMTIHISSNLKDLTKALRQGQAPAGFQLGIAPLPTWQGPAASLANGSSFFLGAASSHERRAAAWSFLEWFESPVQQARWHATTPFFPTRLSAVAQPDVLSLWAAEPELAAGWAAATAPHGPSGSFVGPIPQVESEFDTAVEDIIERGTPVDEALARATTRANQLLTDYNADPERYIRCQYMEEGCRR